MKRDASNADLIFVAHDIGGVGGMELQTAELVGRMAACGVRVSVVARTCRVPNQGGITFHPIRTPRRPFLIAYPVFALAASWRVWRLRRRNPGAVVHSTGALLFVASDVISVHYCHAAEAAAGARRRTTGAFHKRLYGRLAASLAQTGERFVYRPSKARGLYPVSRGLERELNRSFSRMSSVTRTISNGVDSERFRPDPTVRAAARQALALEEDALLVVFVGGDWTRKGLVHAIDALAYAPDWSLIVAGAGPVNDFQRDGLENRIHWMGAISDPERLYALGDAFVLPSSYETFSLVTFEAASSGLPLIVTRVSGPDQLVTDGVNGWFVSQSGSEIAARMNELARSPDLRARMAVQARAAAKPYTWDAVSKEYLAAYVAAGMPEPTQANRPTTTK